MATEEVDVESKKVEVEPVTENVVGEVETAESWEDLPSTAEVSNLDVKVREEVSEDLPEGSEVEEDAHSDKIESEETEVKEVSLPELKAEIVKEVVSFPELKADVPKETVLEEVVPEETVPEETVPEETVQKESDSLDDGNASDEAEVNEEKTEDMPGTEDVVDKIDVVVPEQTAFSGDSQVDAEVEAKVDAISEDENVIKCEDASPDVVECQPVPTDFVMPTAEAKDKEEET